MAVCASPDCERRTNGRTDLCGRCCRLKRESKGHEEPKPHLLPECEACYCGHRGLNDDGCICIN